ncbi:hypothetical protein SAMN06309944_0239 [Micrococcales bacterium KH10]|nr:hypothetical protein SAMN06309944_0239 [Micrococcales bacterium KH10]
MNAAGATAVTAVVFLVASIVVALVADDKGWHRRGPVIVPVGWALFASSCALFIVSAWMAVGS